ncbi:S-adenosyl-l-methionine hydroxide adenosyltransferase, partial [Halorubrum sp. CBA1125]|uniref:SAM hydrolase/SAM-dependent halogenase family protein n=1 Tax=Halorubrum sp. CBA1125 TaxID=2668072 RepID=UPI0012E77669
MITLASDFGSPYPASMKGVVRRETDAEIIDLTHDLPRGDPRAAAFWLRFLVPEFPPAVHCAVVDPGVGTDRAAIAVQAGSHVLVAPDNGLAIPPARALTAADGVEADGSTGADDRSTPQAYRIAVDDPASATFHGRDVFAPAAATIREALGRVDALGDPAATADVLGSLPSLTRTDAVVELTLPEPDVERTGTAAADDGDAEATGDVTAVDGTVLVVDDFGNA